MIPAIEISGPMWGGAALWCPLWNCAAPYCTHETRTTPQNAAPYWAVVPTYGNQFTVNVE